MSFDEITARYKQDGFRRLSWEEYEEALKLLLQKIEDYLEKNSLRVDAVVPILRGGAFPGTYLAYKLNLLRVVPVQYKYFYDDGKIELRQLLGLPEGLQLPESPTFLLVENNHCFGLTANTAAKDIKDKFPQTKLIYAADYMDYSYQKNDYADALFYGKLNNLKLFLVDFVVRSNFKEVCSVAFYKVSHSNTLCN
ncbi:MAG: hypothetical protein A2782_04160 [Candidatus Blackburnbacteria bacterium RIFCSPHIGHO2_01_FULL_43_15b]|uniref:Phosphoribosyltransferase domain-containing protein n=1 Tax=Candidatus Blackburnbacteria bacterium RIFCSPHIGHO2_01_FULL_43_15b TaxID=1797513 RepID=A0A1G1UZW4_9BACT|nr:MAG: hypothetical protein A2782_04160 [Candidatus Blackburnbacteria bacterium RIFCSPHIGHO2_01_FULL_43_15b]